MRAVLLLLAALAGFGFGNNLKAQLSGTLSSSQSAMGSISVPSLMSLQVQTNTSHVRFENPWDFVNGKYFSGFLNMKVVSTQPWMVSFKTINAHFTPLSQGASPNMPVEVMRLKRADTDTWVPLSSNTQTLLYSSNNKISNTYLYDARFELGWNYRAGNYATTILFTLTPQ